MKNITKGEIRRLGERIRSNTDKISEADLELLQLYRISYKESLSKIFTKLTAETKSVYTESILSSRIKRIDSIIRKLKRKPTMQLDRMWDIVGCRCILKNEKQIRKLEKKINETFFVIEGQTRDYYRNENPTGYKSLHLYVRLTEKNKDVIEIQLRTKDDHNWATLVEITDLLFDDNAKESEDFLKTKFGHFHKILSKKKNLNYKQKRIILETVIKNNLYNIISKTFITNYIKVRSQWVITEKNKQQNYFVIVSQKDKYPQIYSFKSFDEAENGYFNQFKIHNKANILLTHLQNNCYEQISIAYSNYILTTHVFIYDFLDIIKETILITVNKSEYRLFNKYVYVYMKIIGNLLAELESEINEFESINKSIENKDRIKDWYNDLMRRLSEVKVEYSSFNKKIKNEINILNIVNKPIFNLLIKRINKRLIKEKREPK